MYEMFSAVKYFWCNIERLQQKHFTDVEAEVTISISDLSVSITTRNILYSVFP
jgi:hypothetical protein